jgi:hypothetical protein
VPSRPQVIAGSVAQLSSGSVPAGTGRHWPAVPWPSQAWQAMVQALAQQTPSTHWPD